MPELPEVELARQVLLDALDREIVAVDDTDQFVCRPHQPGEIAAALKGGRLTGAHRRGKMLWCETSGPDGTAGPPLGLHLGMAGQIIVDGREGPPKPEYITTRADPPAVWFRFALEFTDGGRFQIFDTRRLARVRLDPALDKLGPDAGEIGREEFVGRVAAGRSAVKTRLLNQKVIAGVGNLLADEVLWRAKVPPSVRADEIGPQLLGHLYDSLREALSDAIKGGGVHTGQIIEMRFGGADGRCPRCGAPMTRGPVGGRTTWWCEAEQVAS